MSIHTSTNLVTPYQYPVYATQMYPSLFFALLEQNTNNRPSDIGGYDKLLTYVKTGRFTPLKMADHVRTVVA